jgi:hypothetical protein
MTNQEIMDMLISKKSEKTKKAIEKPKPKTEPKGKRSAYYKGKKINRKKFMEAVSAIFNGELPIRRAYKLSGLSQPTFTKRANQLYMDGFIPGYLVEDGKDLYFEITPPSEYRLIERELERLEKHRK